MDATAYELISRLRRDPQDAEAFLQLRHHYQQRSDFGSLANLLEGWALRCPQPEQAAQAFTEAGDLLQRQLQDPERAAALYRQALERSPLHAAAFTQLHGLLLRLQQPEELADLLQQRAERLEAARVEPRQLAMVHHQLGQLWQEALHRDDRAALHYRRAFELNPRLVPAIYAAREIYRKAGNLRAAARLYSQEADAEPELERKINLLRELAHLLADPLADLPTAIATLEQAQHLAPGDAATQHDLATALLRRAKDAGATREAVDDRNRAAGLLVALAQRAAVEPALAPHAVAYLQAALEAVPTHAAALLLLESALAQAGQRDALVAVWQRFLAADPQAPGHAKVRLQLGRYHADSGQHEDAFLVVKPLLDLGDRQAAELLVPVCRSLKQLPSLVQALRIVAREAMGESKLAALRELMHLAFGQGHADLAVAYGRELLALAPQDVETLALLHEHFRLQGDHAALRDLLLASARTTELPVELRKQRLREAALLSEAKLGDRPEAIALWRMLSALAPDDTDGWAQLARLLEEESRWDEAVAVLQQQAEKTPEDEVRILLLQKIAAMQRNALRDRRAAASTWRRIYELRPLDRATRDALADAYLEAGDAAAAMPLLQKRLEETQDKPQRSRLLRTMTLALESSLHDEEAALRMCERWLSEEPEDGEALEQLERLQTKLGDHAALLQTLLRRLPLVPSEEQGEVALRVARLLHHELGEPERAVAYYWQAWQSTPQATGTLDELSHVYEQLERSSELLGLLREQAVAATEPSFAASLWRRVARLHAKLQQPTEERDAWQRVLVAGEDLEALRAMLRLALQDRQLQASAEIYGRLAAASESPEERRELLWRQANLLGSSLGDAPAAAAVLQTLLQQDPNFLPALDRLCELLELQHDSGPLLPLLARRLSLTEDALLRIPIARRLVAMAMQRQQPALVSQGLLAWAEADTADPEPVERLCAWAEGRGDWQIYLNALAMLAERRPNLASELALRRARVHAGPLQEPEVAKAELLKALKSDVRHPALLDGLLHLASQSTSSHEELQDFLEHLLALLAEAPGDQALLRQVETLALHLGAADRLRALYEGFRRQARTTSEACDMLLRLADLADQQLDDRDQAILSLAQALDLAIGDAALMQRAEQMARRLDGDGEAVPMPSAMQTLTDVYQRRLQRRQDDSAVLQLLDEHLAELRKPSQRVTRSIQLRDDELRDDDLRVTPDEVGEEWLSGELEALDGDGVERLDADEPHDPSDDPTTLIEEGDNAKEPTLFVHDAMPKRQQPPTVDPDLTVAEEEAASRQRS